MYCGKLSHIGIAVPDIPSELITFAVLPDCMGYTPTRQLTELVGQ